MSEIAEIRYELYYWPSIQGRGEFVRLVLEEAAVPYVDVARLPKKSGGGIPGMMKVLRGELPGPPPLAPPVLKAGDLVIAQTTNILQFLASRFGLVPADEPSRLHANQLALTIADLVAEAHDTHHPIASSLYYEDQQTEARRRASNFVSERLPKFLSYFERVLEKNERGKRRHLIGAGLTYVDLAMFQILSGIGYAFPNALSRLAPGIPLLAALRDRVAARPRIAAYLASERRLPFNNEDIFRHYPELDAKRDD
jgi:glutathione S-transferase